MQEKNLIGCWLAPWLLSVLKNLFKKFLDLDVYLDTSIADIPGCMNLCNHLKNSLLHSLAQAIKLKKLEVVGIKTSQVSKPPRVLI